MIAAPVAMSPPLDTCQRIAAFASRASFEATRLAKDDIAALHAGVVRGTPVYVSAVPARPLDEQIETARELAAAGYEVVPHIAARGFASTAELDAHLKRLSSEAKVRRVLVIGGDRTAAAGPYHAAIEVIESGLLQAHGIVEVGVAGYPEGHPRVAPTEVDRALAAKVETAAAIGLALHIVTQFSFSATAILASIARLRDLGIDNPVRIGLAGPATLSGLMRYARLCGVTASVQNLARHAGLARHVFGMIAPDMLLRPLAEATVPLGDVSPHIYSFGGLATAARWTAAVAAGHIALDRADGFTVEPG